MIIKAYENNFRLFQIVLLEKGMYNGNYSYEGCLGTDQKPCKEPISLKIFIYIAHYGSIHDEQHPTNIEISLLKRFTKELVQTNACPHFPMYYDVVNCEDINKSTVIPRY